MCCFLHGMADAAAAAAAPETAMLHTQERDKEKEIGFTDPRRGAAQPTAKRIKKAKD